MTYQDYVSMMPQGDPSDPQYKAWLINKILSGATDYTYGPGSPGATPADMRQVTGSNDNRLVTGNIALPPSDYALFTPAERAQYGIADKSMINTSTPTPRGSVERYYGAGAGNVPLAGGGTPPSSSDPANFGIDIAQGIGSGAPSDSNGLDNKAIGTAIINSAKDSAAKSALQTQQGMQKAASMIMNRKDDPRLQALTKDNPLASLLTTSANNGALAQLLASYFGQMR